MFCVDPPGGLFPNRDYNYTVPMYSLFGIRSIYFTELFIFTALFKAIFKHKIKPLFFNRAIVVLSIYALILLAVSFFIGISPLRFFRTIRFILPYSLLYSIPSLMRQKDDWILFFKLLFPLVFINLGTQLYEIVLEKQFAVQFGTSFIPFDENYGQYFNILTEGRLSGVGSRVFYSYMMNFLISFAATYYLSIEQKNFSKIYLRLILSLALISIILTATRGYIIATAFLSISFLLYSSRNISSLIGNIFVIILVVLLGLFLFPPLKEQGLFVNQRISTLGALNNRGEKNAGLERITTYMPQQLELLKQSPVFGWGFSDVFHANSNGHVGHTNILINAGVLGYLLFGYFWIYFVYRVYKLYAYCQLGNIYKSGLPIIIFGFITFLIIHSTSGQVFQFMIGFENVGVTLLMFLSFSDFAFSSAAVEEIELRYPNPCTTLV